MLAKKHLLVGILTLLSVSLAIADPPAVHPTTGEPLVIDCLRGTPDAIDGDLSDWNLKAMTPAVLDTVEQLYSGQASWDNVADCSGEVYLLWDDVNIYIAAVVKDEKLAMNKTDGSIWNSDCVEIFFATTDAIAEHPWTNPTIHYQYGFNANNQTWNWCNMHGPGQSVPDYLQAASSITADGYICEVSIEYGQMLSLDFSAGNTIGLHPCIDDTDIDDGDTEYQMSWTGLPAHDQSMGYGHMLLSADSVPEPEPIPVDPGTDGLVAYYALDNDTIDNSGNGLDGIIMGDPTFVEGVAGMALDLDGDGDYVDCGTNDVLNNLSDAMTVAAWVNIRSVNHQWMSIVMKGETAWRLGTYNNTSRVHFGFTGGTRNWQEVNSETELPFGEWHHIAGMYKSGVGAIAWVDGVAEAVNPDPDGTATNEMPLYLGENPESAGRFYDGLLDEVRIYDRPLSEGEMLYLAGFGQNLVLNPSFEEDEVILDDPDWYSWGTWNPAEGAGSNATIVDTDAVDGTRSLLIEPMGPENWHFIVLSMPIPTEVGAGYTASFYAKAAEPRPLGVQYKATDNTVSWGYADFDLTTEWAEYSLTADALNAETKLEFFCAASEVSFLLDSVSVVKVAPAPAPEPEPEPGPEPELVFLNGGFEDGVPDPWSTYGDASLEVVQEDPVEGAYCLHVTVNSAGANFWDAGLQNSGHVFVAGKSYTLSAFVKAKEGTMDINFKPERAADPWEGYGEQVFTMTEEWTECTVNTGVIPETVDPASITFHIAFTAGEFYMDDVRFTED